MVDKDKGNPIAVAGGKRRCEGERCGDRLYPFEGPVDNDVGESSDEEQRPELSPPITTLLSLAELVLTLNNFSFSSSHSFQ
eukprot:g15727.t1